MLGKHEVICKWMCLHGFQNNGPVLILASKARMIFAALNWGPQFCAQPQLYNHPDFDPICGAGTSGGLGDPPGPPRGDVIIFGRKTNFLGSGYRWGYRFSSASCSSPCFVPAGRTVLIWRGWG